MPLIIRPKLDMELKIYNTQTVITPSKLKAAFTQSHYSRTVFFSFDTIGENTVGKEFKMGKEFKKFRKAVFVLLIDHLNSFFYPKKTCQCLQYVFSHLIQHYKTYNFHQFRMKMCIKTDLYRIFFIIHNKIDNKEIRYNIHG